MIGVLVKEIENIEKGKEADFLKKISFILFAIFFPNQL